MNSTHPSESFRLFTIAIIASLSLFLIPNNVAGQLPDSAKAKKGAIVTPQRETPVQTIGADKSTQNTGNQLEVIPINQEPPLTQDTKKSGMQNAVLEGIQLSAEPGETLADSIIYCYFIFRDKPTSYFYETKPREKLIVFEFNDVMTGASPIPSMKQPPIQGFRVEKTKSNANKDIVGLKPEWHDVVKVTLYLEAIPKIVVKDEYSVISFSFKWSTNPNKLKELIVKDNGNKPLIYSLIGTGVAIGGGVGALLMFKKSEKPALPKELSIDDLPVHPIVP